MALAKEIIAAGFRSTCNGPQMNAGWRTISRILSIAEDNLIAIEMKKSQRCDDGKIADRDRLRAMTKSSGGGVWSNDGTVHPEHVCGYRLGVYIEIDSDDRKALIEHFVGGERVCSTEISY